MKQYKRHSTNYTKHSKYMYTYYQNSHTLQNPHIHTHTHTHTHTHPHITNKLKQPQYKLKQTQYKIYPNEIVTL
jgi:hypothetical protein